MFMSALTKIQASYFFLQTLWWVLFCQLLCCSFNVLWQRAKLSHRPLKRVIHRSDDWPRQRSDLVSTPLSLSPNQSKPCKCTLTEIRRSCHKGSYVWLMACAVCSWRDTVTRQRGFDKPPSAVSFTGRGFDLCVWPQTLGLQELQWQTAGDEMKPTLTEHSYTSAQKFEVSKIFFVRN